MTVRRTRDTRPRSTSIRRNPSISSSARHGSIPQSTISGSAWEVTSNPWAASGPVLQSVCPLPGRSTRSSVLDTTIPGSTRSPTRARRPMRAPRPGSITPARPSAVSSSSRRTSRGDQIGSIISRSGSPSGSSWEIPGSPPTPRPQLPGSGSGRNSILTGTPGSSGKPRNLPPTRRRRWTTTTLSRWAGS